MPKLRLSRIAGARSGEDRRVPLASAVLAAVASLAAALPTPERVEVALPDGAVKASLELSGFERDTGAAPSERTLLYGTLGDGVIVSLLFERNFPFIAGSDCPKRYAKKPGFAAFDVDGVACCTWVETITEGVVQTTYHAWPTTNDYLFDLHVSRTAGPKQKDGALTRERFASIVRTFRCDGRIDAATLDLPAAVYAFRDEAAAHANDQSAWVETQAKARPDEWAVHFYLGMLGYERGDEARQLAGHARASQLLAANSKRDAKETLALVQCYDTLAAGQASKKRYREALEPLSQLVAAVPAGAPEKLADYRTMALYHLAGCQAATGKAAEAMKNLREAIDARAALKDSARGDELFESLRKKSEFKKLVGS
jgi:hypothetical protein